MKEYRLLFQIMNLEKMIFRTFIHDENLKEKEMIPTPTQMRIIEYILKNEDKEIYQKNLEEVLNLRRATVSGVLQTMEKNHLIERVTDSNDLRSKKIILNQSTKDLFIQKQKQIEEIEKFIIQEITESELETFINVLDKMKENIKKQSLLENKKGNSCLKRKEEK